MSAKLLREENVSLLRSSNFSFIAATAGVTSTMRAGGAGPGGVGGCGISLILVWIPWSSWRRFSSKWEEV